MATLKEAKKDPWKALASAASGAEAPVAGQCWNSRSARKTGDTLIGTVGETKEGVTAYGQGQMLEIVLPNGKASETLFLSKVLITEIARIGGFTKGDKVFVKYLGVPAEKRYAVYAVGKL